MRIACVDLPALPLQLLWRREPGWRAHPTVVVDEDRPQGTILWACERARAQRVLPGQRYAHALGLCAELRAAVVPPAEQAAAIDAIAERLHQRSPEIMRDPDQPGTFWLGGAGLASLYPSATAWGRAIAEDLTGLGLTGAVVVGFSRFATCALARGLGQGLVVYARDADERAAVRAVSLDRYGIDPKLRDALSRLGVTTLGALINLPGGGILDDPELDAERLVFATKAALDRLLARLAEARRALTALSLELNLQHAVGHHERRVDCIRPAAPTLDGRSLLNLVRLRLEHQPPAAGVVAIRVWADDVAATSEQLALFAERPRRDRRAADAALARLRAELGDDAVVRPVLRAGHLPEAQFGWERTDHVVAASPRRDRGRVIVRRIYDKPRRLPPASPHLRDDGWTIDLEHGSIASIAGPYIVSGGWWASEIHREYHYAETLRGDCLWLYFDVPRRRWWHHAETN